MCVNLKKPRKMEPDTDIVAFLLSDFDKKLTQPWKTHVAQLRLID